MSSKISLKLLGAAVALAVAGNAFATNAVQGDIFLNVVDTSNNTSFFFDTGVTQANFNAANPYTFNLGATGVSDPNYAAFVAAQGGSDNIDYSLVSVLTNPGVTSTLQFTSNSHVTAATGAKVNQAQAFANSILTPVNAVPTTTSNSAFVNLGPSSAAGWTTSTDEGGMDTNLGNIFDFAALNTALNFFTETNSNLSSAVLRGTVSQYAGQWNFTQAGLLTYKLATPLPAPLLLLLSGLGLMGIVARRGQSGSNGSLLNGAAA